MIAYDLSQFLSMFIAVFVIFFTFFHDIALINDIFNKKDFLNIAQPRPLIINSWIKLVQCAFSSYFHVNQNFHVKIANNYFR